MRFVALLLWILPLIGIVLCVAMVLYGLGCAVYEMPCELARERTEAPGVTACIDDLDGGEP